MLRPLRTLLTAALLTAALVAPGAADAAASKAVKLSIVPSSVERVVPTPDTPYANVEFISTDGCGSKGVPIAVGWSAGSALIAGPGFYAGSPVSAGYRMTIRSPLVGASTVRAYTRCATGPVAATLKRGAAGAKVSCGAKTALGVHDRFHDAFPAAATFGKPAGRSGWSIDGAADATTICVDKAAFTKVVSVRGTGSFRVGARTATATATCAGGRQALGWGYEAPLLEGNTTTVQDGSFAAAFISAAVPTATSWRLTFHTPDAKGATAVAPVAAWAVCGVPRAA